MQIVARGNRPGFAEGAAGVEGGKGPPLLRKPCRHEEPLHAYNHLGAVNPRRIGRAQLSGVAKGDRYAGIVVFFLESPEFVWL